MARVEVVNISSIQQDAEIMRNTTPLSQTTVEVETTHLARYGQAVIDLLEQVLGADFPTKFRSGRWARKDEQLGQVWLGLDVRKDPTQPENPKSFVSSVSISWVSGGAPWIVEVVHEGEYWIGPLREIHITERASRTNFIPSEAP